MLISYHRGQTSLVIRVKILDSSVSTGAGKTGLSSASSLLIISTIADNEATPTIYTAAGSTIESITTLGTFATPTAGKCRFKEVDSTNHKGVYELQIANARFAVANAKSLLISISGANNAADCDVVIPLTDTDPYDAIRGGATALPNTACTTNASLITSGASTDQLSVSGGKTLLQATQSGVTIPTVTTVSAVTGLTASNLDTTVSSRLASSGYTAPLDASGTRSAVGLASANLDTQLSTIAGYIDTEITSLLSLVNSVKAKTDQLAFTNTNKVDASLQSAADILAAVANKIADHVRRRTQANVEASSDGDTLSLFSEYGFLQMAQQSSTSGVTLTVKKTDTTTTLGTRTLTAVPGGNPVTGVS